MSHSTTRRKHHRELRRVTIGKGSGCAVPLPGKGKLVTTSDTLVEGVHFDLSYMNPRELGHKALAIGLADVAAMGAVPLHAHVTIGVRQETSEPFLAELNAGLGLLARRQKMAITITASLQSPTALLVQTAVIAHAPAEPIGYGGAKSGDLVAVTGTLGISAAGLNCLRNLGRQALTGTHEEILRAHLTPTARVAEARALAATGAATSMIELADGLASDLNALVSASGVGAFIEESALPVSEATVRAAALLNVHPRSWMLYGGEDFELLVTISPKARAKAERAVARAGGSLVVIGEIRPRRDGVLLRDGTGEIVPFPPRLWHHFVRRRRRVAG